MNNRHSITYNLHLSDLTNSVEFYPHAKSGQQILVLESFVDLSIAVAEGIIEVNLHVSLSQWLLYIEPVQCLGMKDLKFPLDKM